MFWFFVVVDVVCFLSKVYVDVFVIFFNFFVDFGDGFFLWVGWC